MIQTLFERERGHRVKERIKLMDNPVEFSLLAWNSDVCKEIKRCSFFISSFLFVYIVRERIYVIALDIMLSLSILSYFSLSMLSFGKTPFSGLESKSLDMLSL